MNEKFLYLKQLTANRNIEDALALAKKLLKLAKSKEEIEIILNCYFKLGEYKTGLQKALKLLEVAPKENVDFLNLWISRLLNSLGASEHALLLVDSLTPQTSSEVYIKAGIYLSNLEYDKAIQNYEEFIGDNLDQLIQEDPMKVLNYTDSLSGLGMNEKAYSLATQLLNFHKRKIDLFIIHSACLEYLCCDFKLSKAPPHLQIIENNIPSGEKKIDFALYLKWKGIFLCLSGNRNEGIPFLIESKKLLQSFSIREETWISCLQYLYQFNAIKKDELIYYYYFPALSKKMRLSWRQKFKEINFEQDLIVNQSSLLFIDFYNEEYCFNETWFLNFKKEIQLIGLCAYAKEQGISLSKCFTYLWPEEPYSYLNFEARLFQLIKRAKIQFNLTINIKDNSVYLKEWDSIGFNLTGQKLPSILSSKKSFKASEFAEWYNLSKPQASNYLKAWKNKGTISVKGHGPGTMYFQEVK